MSSSTRALPPAPPSFPETKPSIYDTSTGLSSAGGHPPRIPSLPNDQTATDDGWGGLIGAEKPKTAQELAEEKKEGEELLRREKVLENRCDSSSRSSSLPALCFVLSLRAFGGLGLTGSRTRRRWLRSCMISKVSPA